MIWLEPDETQPAMTIRPALIVSWQEIVVVMGVMLGLGIVSGTHYGLTHRAGSFYVLFSNRRLLIDTVFQSAMLAALLIFLRHRGWKPADFRIRINWLSSSQGLRLLVFTCLSLIGLSLTMHLLVRHLGSSSYGHLVARLTPGHVPILAGKISLSWTVLIVTMSVNAFFEETVYMAYGFNLWAAKYGGRAAVLFTVLWRLSVHRYQGSEHMLGMAVWADVFGLWYQRHREVWSLILAHLTLDLISLGTLKLMHGVH